MSVGVIMAGGQSARMRATAGPTHKALKPVLGVSLLERNLCALLTEDFRHVAVAVSARDADVERYVLGRGRAIATAYGAHLGCLKETSPRGTIGAVASLDAMDESVVVVNVDNLSSLRLGKLLAFHQAADAAMTIASHVETLRAPCGELRVVEGVVTAYLEKPVTRFAASSGTYVLGPRAIATVDMARRWDAPDLVTALIAQGERVCAFQHDAAWIDVNDAAALARAEQLIRDHADAFELWSVAPTREVVALLVSSPSSALLACCPARARGATARWDVPVEELGGHGAPMEHTAQRLLSRLIPRARLAPQLVTSFDDLDVATRRLVRYHLFTARSAGESTPLSETSVRWMNRSCLDRLESPSAPLVRALAWADRSR